MLSAPFPQTSLFKTQLSWELSMKTPYAFLLISFFTMLLSFTSARRIPALELSIRFFEIR